MKEYSPSRLFAEIAWASAFLMACALCLSACCRAPKPVPQSTPSPSSTGWVTEKETQFQEDKDGLALLTIPSGTTITPISAKGQISVTDISPGEIENGRPPLPEGKKAIAAAEIKPDGMTFTPPATLRFRLPDEHTYSRGDILQIMQCDKSSNKWLPVGEAEVDSTGDFAKGEISHTTVFVLVEPTPPTAAPATRVPVSSLLDDLDATVNVNDYAALMVYFPEEIGNEVVEALTAYTNERGYGVEILWAALPQGTNLEETEYLRDIAGAAEYGPTVFLSIDLSDSNNALLADGAYTTGSTEQAVVQMDTYARTVTLVSP